MPQGIAKGSNVLQALDAWRQRSPDQVAVAVYDSRASGLQGSPVVRDRTTTSELWSRVLSTAAAMRERGIGTDDVVAVQLPNWTEYLVVFLAAFAIGAITTPMSPILRQRDVRRQLELAKAKALFVPASFGKFDYVGMARELKAELDLRLVVAVGGDGAEGVVSFQALQSQGNSADLDVVRESIASGDHARRAKDTMIVNFTSGTSGTPKGVMHSMHSVASCVVPTIDRLQLSSTDVLLVIPTLGHGAGILNGLYLPMLLNATAIYIDGWDARTAMQVIALERVTYAPVMPTYLVDLAELEWPPELDTSCWRTGRVSGGAIPRDVMEVIRSRMPWLRLCPGWGMSETFWSTCGGPDDPIEKRIGSDGRLVGDTQIDIRDKSLSRSLPLGEVGEIVIKGSSLTLGYFHQRELTQNAYTEDGWFKTGDLGRLDAEGYLTLAGRSKDLVIRGGENVPVVEVEMLLHQHPKVRTAVVVGVPDPRLGERVCAVVELRSAADRLTFQEMKQFLDDRQLTTHFIPEHLLIVPELPRTAVGKIMKQNVREQAAKAVATH
ncbi:medium-chain fatty-acid--CoA ligase [soil metagenome]